MAASSSVAEADRVTIARVTGNDVAPSNVVVT